MNRDILLQLSDIGKIDINLTLDRFLGNEGLYGKFLLKFLDDQSFENIKKSVEAGNFSELTMYVHTMKGVAGNLGLQHLLDILSPMMNSLRNGKTDNIEEYLDNLSVQYDAICSVIQKLK